MKMIVSLVLALMISFGFPSYASAQEVIISEYSTRFAWRVKDVVNRAHNVELAASILNGITIASGATFSYNDAIGPRTEKRGFREAHVIINGEMVDGMGGGICQISSTLHAAALLAGLTVTEEHPHSRASLYIDPTLDATVSWDSLDFKFFNNFPFPVRIEAFVSLPEKGFKKQLTVRIIGQADPYDVTLDYKIHKKRSYKSRRYLDVSMLPGTRKKREPGTFGYDMERIRTIRDKKGVVLTREVVKYHYEPSDRIWDVGPKKEDDK